MGATDFSHSRMLKGDASDAYKELVEEAQDEYGHDAYNGQINNTYGFRMRTDNPRFGTKAFNEWESKILEDTDKGDCYCVEIPKTQSAYKKLKNRSRFKGKKGVRFFYFFGTVNF